jgi:hypothetical protein
VISQADVAALDQSERRRLASWLADFARSETLPARPPRARGIVLTVLSVALALLIPWVLFLGGDLPSRYNAAHWRVAWVGFDLALIIAVAATAWFGWRGRQLVGLGMIVTATLLISDAWFDITLAQGRNDQIMSVASAGGLELPMAALLVFFATRLLRALTRHVWALQGNEGPAPPLWQVPIPGVPVAQHSLRSGAHDDAR